MSIHVERTDGFIEYKCSKCDFYSFNYRDYLEHVWNEHDKPKRILQTNFEDTSLNNYALINFSGGD